MTITTDWFPVDTKPVRAGVYQVRKVGREGVIYWRYWNGFEWLSGFWATDKPPSIEVARRMTIAKLQDVEWCGVLAQ